MAYVTDNFDDEIVKLLRDGGVGLLPTDTIYGFSCLALDQSAVKKIHKLKDRDTRKPFIILISDIKMLNMLSISVKHAELIKKYWPGPVSGILPAPKAPRWLQLGTKTLAVRMPNNPELLELISKTGPIVSTSANLQGKAVFNSAQETERAFGNQLDFYVDAGEMSSSSSTLVDLSKGKLKVIRKGAVRIDEKELQ